MIICLVAAFSIPTFVVLSKQDCQGPSICAEARVFGGSKLRAKARVSSPSSVRGQWGYRVQAGTKKQSNSDYYSAGYRDSWEVEKYTATASAYAQNRGKAGSGQAYLVTASESSGG